jgi:hypothetical protein
MAADKSPATTVFFVHPNAYVGNLTIENGLDQANWGYNLNTQVYPTYGGEVVQILSVNITDITLGGSLTTYRQAQLIYSYFARYMQVATQGTSGVPNPTTNDAYTLQTMTFKYPMRGWEFQLMPKTAPGFTYDVELVNPTWSITAQIVDTAHQGGNPTVGGIKSAIQSSAVQSLMGQSDNSFNSLTDQIGPPTGDPNTDPFQTFNQQDENAEAALGGVADYYASMVNGYTQGNFSSIASLGSQPSSTSSSSSSATTAAQATSDAHTHS